MPVDSDRLAQRYRSAIMMREQKKFLITRIAGSDQEADLKVPANGNGLGRIRHFHRAGSPGWPLDPLPIDPAAKALGLGDNLDFIEAQVFQNAACNWRCWYCFVPFASLRGDLARSAWMSASDLAEMYVTQPNRPPVLDLSGGQPELTPEWVLFIMDDLQARGVEDSVYLWSDDNLSSDYFWRYLSDVEQERVAAFAKYGRVGCFKGIDEESFEFNTAAPPALFDRQFELMTRYLSTGIDMYGYVTLTVPGMWDLGGKVRRFLDRLQSIHTNLPLRTVPLLVQVFSPVVARLDEARRASLKHQWYAAEIWQTELSQRFSAKLLDKSITEVPLSR